MPGHEGHKDPHPVLRKVATELRAAQHLVQLSKYQGREDRCAAPGHYSLEHFSRDTVRRDRC
jgi:hypothetical protein